MEDAMKEQISNVEATTVPAPEPIKDPIAPLKQRLQERSAEIRAKVEATLDALDEPTTIEALSKKVGANRLTVAKVVNEVITAKKYNIDTVRCGGYDVIYKKWTTQVR